MFDAVVQKIMFLVGGIAVTFCAGYGLYTLWDLQKLLNLEDQKANRKRTLELCFVEKGACYAGYARDLQDFCNSQMTSGG